MKLEYTFALLLFFILQLNAQTIQRGTVVEMNSGNKPVAGASIMAVGAIPADSDGNGAFQLVFSKAKPGAQVVVSQIYKEGYELVNEVDIRDWILSDSYTFKIVLCKKGSLDISRRKFYDIGQDRYYTLYLQAQGELKKEKESNKLTQKEYADALEVAMGEYERAMSQLTYYADKFARINKDDLNELDAKALSLMEEGRVEDAIKVYEDAEILKKFTEKVSQRDTSSYNIELLTGALEKEILVLSNKKDSASLARIDSIYRVLLHYDSTNYIYNLNYASFLITSDKADEAFDCLKRSMVFASGEEERNKAESIIDQLFIEVEDKQTLDGYKKQLDDIYKEIEEKKEIESLKKIAPK